MRPLMSEGEIRQAFLNFFASHGHQVVPSAPIVLKDDPTLMFTNAGMNQFKSIFLGEALPKALKVADTQKCLRVSGKHNDLEEVGVDTYHHTMFEMLGNWSFGDYFKKEAIGYAWQLLTEVYKLDKSRLYVTVFEGDASEGLTPDTEAEAIWQPLVQAGHIINGNKKDNFWEMGDTGPCGPCTEIHYDNRSHEDRSRVPGYQLVNKDHPQVIEIWNIVFIQYNRAKNGSLAELPQKHIDTGMGFERLVRVIQGRQSNYDTDVFQPLIARIAAETGHSYGNNEKEDIAFRVIADHARALTFTIADGQLPSNAKAGYVTRRILRRAIRYGYTYLGAAQPFIYNLVQVLAHQFQSVFPEVAAQQDFIAKVIFEEEKLFLKTLTTGIARFEKHEPESGVISGNFAFELYDTFGFPYDLTELMAKEKGYRVDEAGFLQALEVQKNRSRSANTIHANDWVEVTEGATTSFVGYDSLSADTRILRYRQIESKEGKLYQLVLEVSPFYAESGGQVGDTGTLTPAEGGEEIQIIDTRKENQLPIVITKSLPVNINGVFKATVTQNRRRQISNNHSATHLLHAALKQVLGQHVNQKGSLVTDGSLRFDFSHFSKVTETELNQVEEIVNQKIWQNIPLVEQRSVPYQQAITQGVTALFGEKYGDEVRIITFDENFSKELCGGTHVPNTGTIGLFKIKGEASVAAGVRRIEAVTQQAAFNYVNNFQQQVQQAAQQFKNARPLAENIAELHNTVKSQKATLQQLQVLQAQSMATSLAPGVQTVNGVQVLVAEVADSTADGLKNISVAILAQVPDSVIVLYTQQAGKPMLSVAVGNSLSQKYNAAGIIKILSPAIHGGGGGTALYATSGGKSPVTLTHLKQLVYEVL